MSMGQDLKDQADLVAAYEALEQKLYDEYTVRLEQQRKFIVDKVHQYLEYELGKMAASFPEHQGEIAAWKNNPANAPEAIVEDAALMGADAQYVQDLEDRIEELEAEMDVLLKEFAARDENELFFAAVEKKPVANQVDIE